MGRGKTVITVAHRLSTIFDSDFIFVFDQGNIVQLGTHQQLLGQKDGLYHRLVHMQTLDKSEEEVLI